MTSLENVYHEIAERHPSWSSYICFTETIKGRKLEPQKVHRLFRKLVDKEDYSGTNIENLFFYLDTLFNPLQKSHQTHKNAPRRG